jgi:hypothetical protein
MEDPEAIVLSAQLIRDRQIIGCAERALHFFGESEPEEATPANTLEETINNFISSIEQACKEKNVEIVDGTKVAFDLTIKLLAFKAEEKILIDVAVRNLEVEEDHPD